MTTTTLVTVTMDDLKAIMKECFALAQAEAQNSRKDESEFVTTEEVMDLLKCSRPTLWRWQKDEFLCPVKVQGKNFYRLSDVKQIMHKS